MPVRAPVVADCSSSVTDSYISKFKGIYLVLRFVILDLFVGMCHLLITVTKLKQDYQWDLKD